MSQRPDPEKSKKPKVSHGPGLPCLRHSAAGCGGKAIDAAVGRCRSLRRCAGEPRSLHPLFVQACAAAIILMTRDTAHFRRYLKLSEPSRRSFGISQDWWSGLFVAPLLASRCWTTRGGEECPRINRPPNELQDSGKELDTLQTKERASSAFVLKRTHARSSERTVHLVTSAMPLCLDRPRPQATAV